MKYILFTIPFILFSCNQNEIKDKTRINLIEKYKIHDNDRNFMKESYLKALSMNNFSFSQKKPVYLIGNIDLEGIPVENQITAEDVNYVKKYLCTLYILGKKQKLPSTIKIKSGEKKYEYNEYGFEAFIEEEKKISLKENIDEYENVIHFHIPKVDFISIKKNRNIEISIDESSQSLLEFVQIEDAGFRAILVL